MKSASKIANLAMALVFVACCASAQAAPLGLSDCGASQGVYQCSGVVRTWDGVPLDTTVTLPSANAAGPLPLIADLHGFGNSKWEYLDPASDAYTGNAYTWAKAGYAVLTYTARGLWGSCGSPDARAAGGADCVKGWIHLADVRYEARDTQELIGRLVDDGTADAERLGVTGDSYGGGQSLELAALRNRTMLPDGTLVPWQSPKGVPLSLGAAAPVIPWSDLMGAIAPNGHTNTTEPVGVFKTSFMNGIAAAAQFATGPGQPVGQPFIPGRPMGFLAPPGVDPDADVVGWVERADRGEPYDDADAQATVARLERYHSAYTIDASAAPPPLFIAGGFTDDLFPVDEALRFADRTRNEHPRTPVSLMFGDFGHQRAANKPADRKRLLDAIRVWMDYWLRGIGSKPITGVLATTQTCPRSAPSGGPFTAATFAGLARGAIRFESPAVQAISSTGGDPQVAAAIDPVAGGGDACATTKTDTVPGTAVYKLPPSKGWTLLGAPTVSAKLSVTGTFAQIAARLWDVAPDGSSQTLVARGTYRPVGSGATETFRLHANGWRFAPGHVPKLELLGADAPYTRVSNGAFQIGVTSLALRLPAR
ncbi:MAG TPA: CocE/NonD family hydrolase [Thermoleophilaceae bacterium]|nr:CocE/NonD family hydrolase [Thermoleophilaceae bacterium]